MPIPASRAKAPEPITTSGVKHVLRLTCQASTETGQRQTPQIREDLLYVLKGGASRRRRPGRCLRPALGLRTSSSGSAAAPRPANHRHDDVHELVEQLPRP